MSGRPKQEKYDLNSCRWVNFHYTSSQKVDIEILMYWIDNLDFLLASVILFKAAPRKLRKVALEFRPQRAPEMCAKATNFKTIANLDSEFQKVAESKRNSKTCLFL